LAFASRIFPTLITITFIDLTIDYLCFMLRKLFIKNYALIEELSLDFESGFTVITGETGSGKSILLGALGLILGNRSDSSVMHNEQQKCVVEGEFDISEYHLKEVFEQEDLDYNERSFFRREILPSGRSRAFINDTPVSLSLLKSLGERLVDIHSQHDIIMLKNNTIQLNALDAFAKNDKVKNKYFQSYKKWLSLKNQYKKLKENIVQSNKDKDYIEFQLREFQEAGLKLGEKKSLEEELNIGESAEEIKSALNLANELLSNDQRGMNDTALMVENALVKIADKSEEYAELLGRIKSVRLEISDIQTSIEQEELNVSINPERLLEIQSRLDQLYRLESKHRVEGVDQLLEIEETLSNSLFEADELEKKLAEIEMLKEKEEKSLVVLAEKLSTTRQKNARPFEKKVKQLLKQLSMEKASIKVGVERSEDYKSSGIDQVNFNFSANSGSNFQELSKVASGGELSRVMLAIKSILADRSGLPVLIFDEIDTGISGKVSGKVAQMMLNISEARQVFSITHQAQVASLGNWHYKVSKAEVGKRTITSVKSLNKEERIQEIAEMLSGDSLSEHSLANATELLEQDA